CAVLEYPPLCPAARHFCAHEILRVRSVEYRRDGGARDAGPLLNIGDSLRAELARQELGDPVELGLTFRVLGLFRRLGGKLIQAGDLFCWQFSKEFLKILQLLKLLLDFPLSPF